jgi:hypothetical protein
MSAKLNESGFDGLASFDGDGSGIDVTAPEESEGSRQQRKTIKRFTNLFIFALAFIV